MTHLCVSIFVTDLAQAKRDIASAAEAGADLVEFRIDTFTEPDAVSSLIQQSILPCIVTCRPTWEGGQCELPEDQRLALLNAAADGASHIDIELAAPEKPRASEARLIISSHDFTGRPARMANLLLELQNSPADVVKLAWTARTVRDNLEAFEILRARQKPTIALCMGEAGMVSRILAKKFGASLTFASLDAATPTASGQVPIGDLKNLYRWDALSETTKVYGVVGNPVGHSMSPAIHNAAFAATGLDAIYLPFLVESSYESFKAFMESFLAAEGLDLSGLSITIPHKENALRYLKEKGATIDPLAERIGAVNTIVISNPKSAIPNLSGLNTDYAAILDSITAALGILREDLAARRVAVIGAGGAGRSAVAALAHYGAAVTIYNRTREKARRLAEEFDGQTGRVSAEELSQLPDSAADIYINTTPIGMSPKTDAVPWSDHPPRLSTDTLVFDTVYNPPTTRLLSEAAQAGAKTISGIEMFIRQAAAQFEAWTGKPAPAELMRQVLLASFDKPREPR